jgi:hypothetical protein
VAIVVPEAGKGRALHDKERFRRRDRGHVDYRRDADRGQYCFQGGHAP